MNPRSRELYSANESVDRMRFSLSRRARRLVFRHSRFECQGQCGECRVEKFRSRNEICKTSIVGPVPSPGGFFNTLLMQLWPTGSQELRVCLAPESKPTEVEAFTAPNV